MEQDQNNSVGGRENLHEERNKTLYHYEAVPTLSQAHLHLGLLPPHLSQLSDLQRNKMRKL
jgi:hypothetical protein